MNQRVTRATPSAMNRQRVFLPTPFFLGLVTGIAYLLFATPAAQAGLSAEHYERLDWYDWQEQRGYNAERDEIMDIGDWNRREIEGKWPEVDYSYYEWDDDWYYEDEE